MGITLNFLGDPEVIRDGRVLTLPPSRKTRALLAYLALGCRSFSREHLCDLLWEVPDDPRGALRWSLSKLRRLVDEPHRPRILANRLTVAFDPADVDIDVAVLHALVARGVDKAPTVCLEASARRYRGAFLEGLDVPCLHDFHSWCLAEREQCAWAQKAVLEALVQRLEATPEQALGYARSHVRLSPYDEAARARLIRLLVAMDRSEEAEQHYHLGLRMLKEAGVPSSGDLYRAWRGRFRQRTGGGATRGNRGASTGGVIHRPSRDRLVGRDEELEFLLTAFSGTRFQRQARVVLLTGEPGIGKSTLLEGVGDVVRATGTLLLEAAAIEADAMRPFALWVDALRRLGAADTGDIFGAMDHGNRDGLFDALNGRIVEMLRHCPVALLVDDMQWCDASSATALHYVVRSNRDEPLFVLLAARDAEVGTNDGVQPALRGLRHQGVLEELALRPLAEPALHELIREHAPQADCQRLGRQCGGNPLLAIELARAEAAGGSGGSLDELVRERLIRMDAEGREVIRWAAVLAPRVDVALIMLLTELDAGRIGGVVETAERMGILRATQEGLRFSHDLVAGSIYAAISPTRRQIMHRRVAALLQETSLDPERAGDLAHHALQSGDAGLAAQAMVSAGRLCLRFFANEDALTLARRGAALAAQLPRARRVCLRLELHEIMLNAAPLEDWESTAGELVHLAEQALEYGELAHARLGYQLASTVRWAHGHWTGAQEEALEAERVTRNASERDHVIGMAETAKCLAMLERDMDRARAMVMNARALAGAHGISYHAIPMALGLLRFHEDSLGEAERHFKEARTLSKAAGDRLSEFQAIEYLMLIDFERGQYASALARCGALREIGEKLRDGSEGPFARAADGLCRYALDDDAAALAVALEDLRDADAKYRLACILTRAALLDLQRGRLEQAVQQSAEALVLAQTLERATEMSLAHYVLGEASRLGGDDATCARHAAAIARFDQTAVALWARNRYLRPEPGEVPNVHD